MIKEDIETLLCATQDLIIDNNKDIGLVIKRVEDWLASPSCPLVDEEEFD